MSPEPWWRSYPRRYWTTADWRAAGKAGVVPPLPGDNIDPLLKLQHETSPKLTAIGGLYADRDREGERRRKASEALEKAGLRPPSTW